MKYQSGEIIEVGDHVLIEHGKTPGIVEFVIESEKDIKLWDLDEAGVLLKSAPFGAVFWPIAEIDDPVIFVSRGTLE